MKDWLPLIGVVIAQCVILLLFWFKQRADDKRRWHEKRLDAYRALSKAGRDASLVFASAEEVEDLDDHRFVKAMDDGDACMLDIALVSSSLVREKADALQTIMEMCVVFDPKSEAFPTAEMLLDARYDFERAVRQELGIDRRERFVVQGDSKTELVWNALKTFLVIGYGRVGLAVADRIEPLVLPNKKADTPPAPEPPADKNDAPPST